ncbi:DUF2721 domain-containing protein [Sphingomonas glacialis]|uniref:DUF2721 domain-containing protein n=1 Tax=Sphingomonas glacialis TaxID=658225 RepID=A0A502FRA9_9SPHN|nr:DUF2721 domain-containing protein [Sphingomonas glacialis]TPG52097.1 DUF2721 domain-containing protein [Sphingomonas glacialis]
MTTHASLDAAAQVVQLALTPVFLLSGLAALLNVFTSRLGRVADRVGKLTEDPGHHARQLAALRRRTHVLDVAVLTASIAGALTCFAVLSLFVGALGMATTGRLLFALFGAAVVFTVVALAAFAAETLLSSVAVREQVDAAS